MTILIGLLWFLFKTSDIFLTEYALQHGFQEVNPIAQVLLNKGSYFSLALMFAVGLGLIGIYEIFDGIVRKVLWYVVLSQSVIVLYGLGVLLIK